MTAETERIIARFEAAVIVHLAGKAAAYTGAYAGRGKGNFRFKAALESSGNRIHNDLADQALIPGQTGMDVDRRPEGPAADLDPAADPLHLWPVDTSAPMLRSTPRRVFPSHS